jgi:hypothetical protein
MSKNRENLDKISSESFNKSSLNLSFFNSDIIESILSLIIIEDDNFLIETLEKYRYFDNFFVLKIDMDYYFVNTAYIDVYYTNSLPPLKLNDYNIFQRKDKLKKIQKNIDINN